MPDDIQLHPERVRLNDLVAYGEKRMQRAAERLDGAQRENNEATAALAIARDRLAAWIEANPDPQMELI